MMSATLRNVWPTAAAMLGLLALAAGVAWILTARKAAAENQSPWPQPVALPDADASAIKEGSASDPSAPSMCPLPDLNAAAEESPAMPTAHNEASTSPVRATVPSKPGQVQSATFALGWFWGPDSRFGSLPGVLRTRVGYSGGTKESPTYHDLGDHTESVEIDFDPAVISFKDLVDVFVRSHNPCARPYSRQYISIAFYRDEEQKKVILDALAAVAKKTGKKVQTAVEPFKRFYRAEDYHQKYYLRNKRDTAAQLRAIYPDERGFIDATAAARANGWAGGHLTGAALKQSLAQIDAPTEERAKLERLAESLSR